MLRWITVCLAASLVQPAAAGAIDEKLFATFESLCLDNINETGRVSLFADANRLA
jgi:hypothetical protein